MVLWTCAYDECASVNVTARHLPRRCERCGRLTLRERTEERDPLTEAERRVMEDR